MSIFFPLFTIQKYIWRRNKVGEVEEIRTSGVIIDYTNNIGAVDYADQYIQNYGLTRKSVKFDFFK